MLVSWSSRQKRYTLSFFNDLRGHVKYNNRLLGSGGQAEEYTSTIQGVPENRQHHLETLLKTIELQVQLSEELGRMENGIAKANIAKALKEHKFPTRAASEFDLDYLAVLQNAQIRVSLIASKPPSSTTPQMPSVGEQERQEVEGMGGNDDLSTAGSEPAVTTPGTKSPRSQAQMLGRPTNSKRSAQTPPNEALPQSKRPFLQSLLGRRSSSVGTSSSGKEDRVAIRLDLAGQDSRRMYWTPGQTRDDFFQKVQSLFRNSLVDSVQVHIQGENHTVDRSEDIGVGDDVRGFAEPSRRWQEEGQRRRAPEET